MPTLKVFMRSQNDLLLCRPGGPRVVSVCGAETGHEAHNSGLSSFLLSPTGIFTLFYLNTANLCISGLFFPDLAVLGLHL